MEPYREPRPPARGGQVTWGPFPVRGWHLAVGVLFLGLALIVETMVCNRQRLQCDRAADQCVVEMSRYTGEKRTFALSHLVRVDVKRWTHAGRPRSAPLLRLRPTEGVAGTADSAALGEDRDVQLMTLADADVESFSTRVNAALASKTASFRVDLAVRPWVLALISLIAFAFGAMGATSLYAGLRGWGRYRLQSDPRFEVLTVRHSVLGIPVSTTRCTVEGVRDVEVEWARKEPFGGGHVEKCRGRLVLVRNDDREPLTRHFHPGFHLHRRAETALRALLGCPERDPARQCAIDDEATSNDPGPQVWSVFARITGAVVSAFFGALIGIVGGSVMTRGWGLPEATILAVGGVGGAVPTLLLWLWLSRSRPIR